ncbi:MAG TPA: hypothetical protein PLM79_09635 [Syntrophobacteraceae bacterium]|nr:hypothetical protein [Syntrophobacteraceae bacterium]
MKSKAPHFTFGLLVFATFLCFSPVFAYESSHDGGGHEGEHGGTETPCSTCGQTTHHTFDHHSQASHPEDIVKHLLHPAIPGDCLSSHFNRETEHAGTTKEIHYDAQGNPDYYYTMAYDAAGRISRIEHHSSFEGLQGYTICRYNSSGLLVRTLNYDMADAQTGYTQYVYNNAGKLVTARTYEHGSLSYTTKCSYNSLGRLVKVSQYDAGGALQWYRTCQYNANGHLTKTMHRDPAGRVIESKSYEHNGLGQLNKVLEHNADGVQIGSCSYTYDANGQTIKAACYDPNNNPLGRAVCSH